ncbi:MAG: LysE family transporter [Bacteroidales bacterium]|nr:LysE family transporter [Bacteroidales bacterium]
MIFIAFGIGLIISVPLGPLGQMMLNKVVDRGSWHGFTIAVLSSLADFFICEFFLIGTVSVGAISPWIKIVLQLVGLVFLLYMGIKEIILPYIKNKRNITPENKDNDLAKNLKIDEKSLLKNIAIVVSYYISNPTYLAFWLSFSVLVNQKFIVQHDLLHYTLFSFFFALGTLTCQYIAIKVVQGTTINGKMHDALKYISITLYSGTLLYFIYQITQNIIQII